MSPMELLQHAKMLLTAVPPTEADRRRAVSASYYALFNAITVSAANTVGPDAPAALRNKLRRTFTHKGILKVATAFAGAGGAAAVSGFEFIAVPVSLELRNVCDGFRVLLREREASDYDLSADGAQTDAETTVLLAELCLGEWARLEGSPAAQTFLAALFLFGRHG